MSSTCESFEASRENLPRVFRRGLERIETPSKLTLAVEGEVEVPAALYLPFLLTIRQSEDEEIEETLEVPATSGVEEGPATVPSEDTLARSTCLPLDASKRVSVGVAATD